MPGASRSVAVVGGGFGGVAAATMLRRAGYDDVTVFERGERIGGVWHHNTYPGAACDIPSHLYELSFAPNPRWSRRHAPQAEIQAYVEEVAERYAVVDRIRTGVEVESAHWSEERGRWQIETSAGPHEAEVLITACGQLSVPKVAALPGAERFEGPSFHTARWRHDVELEGKRVAVVGTGCSAIQSVPEIQPIVERVDVYQRSPGWTLRKRDFAYPRWALRLFERFPLAQRLDRAWVFGITELLATALTSQRWMIKVVRLLGERQISSAIDDPELRAKVTPGDEPGCKRLMFTDDWYPTLAKPNVELVTEPIVEVTARGIRDRSGREREADVLVYATGFESHAFVAPMQIVGREGRSLAEEWAEVATAYFGLSVPGFPNMFMLYGPNTNSGSSSVIYSIEAGLEHVISALREMDRAQAKRIEIRREAADRFDGELREALERTVWHTGCTNWYVDEKGNDPSQWPWNWTTYRRRVAQLEPGAYELAGERAQA